MSVAKVSEIVSELTRTTTLSLDEAIKQGIAGGNRKLRNVRVWWIKEERVTKGSQTEYQVNMMIGFVIDEDTYVVAKGCEGRTNGGRRLPGKGREVHR